MHGNVSSQSSNVPCAISFSPLPICPALSPLQPPSCRGEVPRRLPTSRWPLWLILARLARDECRIALGSQLSQSSGDLWVLAPCAKLIYPFQAITPPLPAQTVHFSTVEKGITIRIYARPFRSGRPRADRSRERLLFSARASFLIGCSHLCFRDYRRSAQGPPSDDQKMSAVSPVTALFRDSVA